MTRNEPSPGAIRMQRLRERRHYRARCVTVEIMDHVEIELLVKHGFLDAEKRGDPKELAGAVYLAMDATLARLEGRTE